MFFVSTVPAPATSLCPLSLVQLCVLMQSCSLCMCVYVGDGRVERRKMTCGRMWLQHVRSRRKVVR